MDDPRSVLESSKRRSSSIDAEFLLSRFRSQSQ